MKSDKYLVTAITLLKTKPEGIFNDNGKVVKEMPGYISSFGAAIIQSGLLPAVALFSQKEGQGKSKEPLMNALARLVSKEQNTSLLALSITNEKNNAFRTEVTHAAVALKLAMRTFDIEKSNNSVKNG